MRNCAACAPRIETYDVIMFQALQVSPISGSLTLAITTVDPLIIYLVRYAVPAYLQCNCQELERRHCDTVEAITILICLCGWLEALRIA